MATGDQYLSIIQDVESLMQKNEQPLAMGFTGTREGMTIPQFSTLQKLVNYLGEMVTEVHHGMCVGSDEQFDKLAKAQRLRRVGHPCDLVEKQAVIGDLDDIWPVKPPLDRNPDIVDESAILVATPKTTQEQARSGTWATIRYAQRQNAQNRATDDAIILVIITPEGDILR